MSFRIEEWQVMQAWKNGARIASTSRVHPNWVLTENPEWNWKDNDYRIADLTGDYIRLDQLVEIYPERVVLLDKIYFESNWLLGTADSGCEIKRVIEVLANYPQCISMIKIKPKQEKKLRPWTMEEFKQYRDEWFVTEGGDVFYKAGSISKGRVIMGNVPITFKEMMNQLTREDGSPCGVLE